MPRAEAALQDAAVLSSYGSTAERSTAPQRELAVPLRPRRPLEVHHSGVDFATCGNTLTDSAIGCFCPCLLYGRTLHRAGLTKAPGTGAAIYLMAGLVVVLCCALLIVAQLLLDHSSIWHCFLENRPAPHGSAGHPQRAIQIESHETPPECLDRWRASAGGSVDDLAWVLFSLVALCGIGFNHISVRSLSSGASTVPTPAQKLCDVVLYALPVLHCCALCQDAWAVGARAGDDRLLPTLPLSVQDPTPSPVQYSTSNGTISPAAVAGAPAIVTVGAAIRRFLRVIVPLFGCLLGGYMVLAFIGWLLFAGSGA